MQVGPLRLKNPIMTASGCAGYGEELARIAGFDFAALGAFVAKSVSLDPIPGNAPPRVAEAPGGMLNAIGLQNSGIEHFIDHYCAAYRTMPCPVIASLFGLAPTDYVELARRIQARAADAVAAVELNVSCPNTEKGGIEFGADPDVLRDLTAAVRAVTALPLIVKLSPNVTDIAKMAAAAVVGGADALTVANTYYGLGVQWRTGHTRLSRGSGGLSGPGVKPMVLHAIFRIRRALPEVPIIASGGASTAEDVLECVCVGANAVQIGTAAMIAPMVLMRLPGDISDALDRAGRSTLESVRNTAVAGPPKIGH